MRVVLLYGPDQYGAVQPLADLLKEMKISFTEHSFPGENDLSSLEELFARLEEATHFCLAVLEGPVTTGYLFSAAYILGKKARVFLFTQDKQQPLPGFFKGKPFSDSTADFKNYLDLEKKNWDKEFIRQKTEKELEERGIPFTEEGFSRVVEEGDKPSLELFLKTDFPVNFKNSRGITPLCLAVRNNHRVLIPLLLKKKADINALSDDRHNSALMDAASGGNTEILEDLIRAGAELNYQSKNGQTALILTVGGGHTDCAEILIRAGADINITDKVGLDAFAYAKLFNQTAILKMLEHAKGRKDL